MKCVDHLLADSDAEAEPKREEADSLDDVYEQTPATIPASQPAPAIMPAWRYELDRNAKRLCVR